MDYEGQLTLVLENILKTRERRLRSITIKEYLVRWKDLPSEDATWEEEKIFQHPNMKFIEDNKSCGVKFNYLDNALIPLVTVS